MSNKIHPLSLRGIFQCYKITITTVSAMTAVALTIFGAFWYADPTNHPDLLARVNNVIGGSCDDKNDKNRRLIRIGYKMDEGKYYVVCGDYDSDNRAYTNIENVGDWEVILK